MRQARPPHLLWRIAALALLLSFSLPAFAAGPPVLSFSTFFGGAAADEANVVRTDRNGNVYVAGTTSSTNFPVTANALQKDGPGNPCVWPRESGTTICVSMFVAKFSPDGALLYSTYLGRGARHRLIGMDVDAAGSVYVAASYADRRPSFPDPQPLAGDTSPQSGNNIYVAKIVPDGSALAYATYLPRPSDYSVEAMTVDGAGSVYLTGNATLKLPVVNAFQPEHNVASYFKTSDAGQTWTAGVVGSPSDLVSMVAVDLRNPQTVYIGVLNGIYRSSDGGAHWALLADGIEQALPMSLVFDPSNAGTMYLVTGSRDKIYKTTDNGATLRAAGVGIDANVAGVAVDPKNSGIVYAATNKALFRSTDGAVNWTPIMTGDVWTVAIDPGTPSTLYATTPSGAVKSADSGATWTALANVSDAPADLARIVTDAADPKTLYAITGTDASLYRSSDGGTHWTRIALPPTAGFQPRVTAFLIDAAVHTTLWAATTSGLLVSRDSGATWSRTATELPKVDVFGLAGSSAGLYAISTNWPLGDAFAMKIDASGSRLVYSTYLGGSGTDRGWGIAVDGAGRAFIAGETDSFDLPRAGGARARIAGGKDAFVMALDASGQLVWSTYLGGSADDGATAVALDSAGNIHLAGTTESVDLPLVSPSYLLRRPPDGFAAKFKSDGSALLFSTYIGGSGTDTPNSVAADAQGNTYIGGTTGSGDLPVVNAVDGRLSGNASAFAAGWNDEMGTVQFLTYLGRGFTNYGRGMTVDANSGALYMVGSTTGDFDRKYAFQDAFGGGPSDGFVAKLAPAALSPRIALNGVADAAGYRPTVAPGELVALFGRNLAMNTAQAGGFPLPLQLADLKVTVNGIPAPLYYVSPYQVNAQIPYDTASGTARIEATSTAGTATFEAQVAAAAPAIFSLDASGTGAGAIQHGLTYQVVSDSNPAVAGEIVAIYCTGLGAVDPAVATGAAAGAPLSYSRVRARAYVGGVEAEVTYSGLTPGLAGLYQVNAVVPTGLAPGAQPLEIAVGAARSRAVSMVVR